MQEFKKLTAVEKAVVVGRHRKLIALLHPSTTHGYNKRDNPKLVTDPKPWRYSASEKFGIPTVSLYKWLGLYRDLSESLLLSIMETGLNTGVGLHKLRKVHTKQRGIYIQRYAVPRANPRQYHHDLNEVVGVHHE